MPGPEDAGIKCPLWGAGPLNTFTETSTKEISRQRDMLRNNIQEHTFRTMKVNRYEQKEKGPGSRRAG